jgi:hypothetical protein
MARSKSNFTQRDVTRAVKGVRAAGEGVARVEIGADGKIVIVVGKNGTGHTSELDRELEEFARCHDQA